MLKDYGNEAGGAVETYFTFHGSGQSQVLRNFLEDRANPDKSGAVEALADGLSEAGETLKQMGFIPAEMADAHKRLAGYYKVLAVKLRVVAKARADEDLLTAIEDYNGAADEFARSYLAIVSIFGTHEVTFDSGEPGRVFTFTPSSISTTGGLQ